MRSSRSFAVAKRRYRCRGRFAVTPCRGRALAAKAQVNDEVNRLHACTPKIVRQGATAKRPHDRNTARPFYNAPKETP